MPAKLPWFSDLRSLNLWCIKVRNPLSWFISSCSTVEAHLEIQSTWPEILLLLLRRSSWSIWRFYEELLSHPYVSDHRSRDSTWGTAQCKVGNCLVSLKGVHGIGERVGVEDGAIIQDDRNKVGGTCGEELEAALGGPDPQDGDVMKS